jgi:hypothetical protein
MNSKPEMLTVNGHTIRVYRQRRRSLVMKTTPLGLVLFIPKRTSLRSDIAREFIAEALGKLAHKSVASDLPLVTSAAGLRTMVKAWAVLIGVQPTRVSVREMFRKWGSCSSKGSISLNTALCRVPHELAEYVIVHELVHLLEFNHGKGFKALMDRHLPDWHAREQQLQTWMEGGTLD